MDKKEILLQEIKTLIHPSGRKIRSDLGKSRKEYHSSDAEVSPMSIYKRVLTQLLNKASKNEDNNLVTYDINGYYCLIEEKFVKEFGDFKDIKANKSRTVKYKRVQNKIDLEQFRFNAWYDKAINTPNERVPLPNKDLTRWCYECYGLTKQETEELLNKKQFTWIDLFCTFYHIEPFELYKWTYEVWREHYERCPKEFFDSDFKFRFATLPGTLEFHPEWAYKVKEREAEKLKDKEDKKAMHSYAAKISAKTRRYN